MTDINCRISTVHQLSEDTLFIDIDADIRFDVEDFYELKRAALKIGEGKSFYNIVKVGAFTLPTRKAREVSCSVEGSYYKKADAFVLSTFSQKLFCKLLIKLNKPVVPTKCFDTLEQAQEWLKSLKEEKELQPVNV